MTSQHAPSRIRKDIEGLRALAVVSVILFHAGVPGLAGGYVGVDVFFVISGYLITGLLYNEHTRSGRVSFKEFYARRIRRLLPASTLVLLGVMIGAFVFLPPLGRPRVAADAVASALFFSNIRFAREATNYFADTQQPAFQHYWSLSVEEQFYLVFPALLVGLLWLRRRLNVQSLVTAALIVITVGSFAFGVQQTSTNPLSAFFLLPTRAWELGIGALLAVSPIARSVPTRIWNRLSVVGIAAIVFACLRFDAFTPFPGWAAAVPVLGTAVILAAGADMDAKPGIVGRALSIRPFQWIGRHSYALYLLHWPFLVFLFSALSEDQSYRWVYGMAAIVLAVVPLSWASGFIVENPIRNSSWLRDRAGLTLAGGAACISLVLLVSLIRPVTLDTGRRVEVVSNAELLAHPTDFVPSNLTPSLQNAYLGRDLATVHKDGCAIELGHESTQAPCVYGDKSSKKTIVLFGDSHAAHWFGPIEEYATSHNMRLVVFTKNSCSSLLIDTHSGNNGCAEWKQRSVAKIKQLRPELLVISNLSMLQFKFRPDGFAAAVATAAPELAALGRLVVLGESPSMREPFPSCASDHLANVRSCEPSPTDANVTALNLRLREAIGTHGAFVDVQPWLCSPTRCPGIVGNVLVYADEDHITDTFARTALPQLRAAFDQALAVH